VFGGDHWRAAFAVAGSSFAPFLDMEAFSIVKKCSNVE